MKRAKERDWVGPAHDWPTRFAAMTSSTAEPVTQHYNVAPGVGLMVDHWGELSDHVVMFLHGGGQTRHSWGATAELLAEQGRHAITVDLRGHGESDWDPTGDYALSRFAEDIATLIDQLAITPLLVGASLGGMTGMMLEGTVRPGSVEALVLVDIVPRMNEAGADRIKDFMLANADTGFESLEEVADAVAAYNPHRARPSDLNGLKKNLRLREGRWFWHWDPAFLQMGSEERSPEVRDPELLTRAMQSADVPILLIRGRMSDLVTEEGAAGFLEEFPHARFVDVSDAGHMVAGDKNDVFTAAVVDFIDSL